jgi:hypothetical protein
MASQSEHERNKAVVDEYYKAGVQGHLTSFAAYLHPDFTVAAPNYLPWGSRHVGAAFFRDHLLPGVTDVFDFARFSLPRMATSWRYSTSAILESTRSLRLLTTGRYGMARPSPLWAAYFEPQAVLEKLGIKLPVDGEMFTHSFSRANRS